MSAAGDERLPNLIVIGAMSCGTTALHNLLDLHPEVGMSRPKELNFFVGPEPPELAPWIADPVERRLVAGRRNRALGPRWYRSHFDPAAAVRGESSPGYCAPYNCELAAERIAALIPDCRIVMITRDPIECMVSQYRHHRAGSREPRPPSVALADPAGIYANRARFALQLEPYLRRFGDRRVLVLTAEALRADPERALEPCWRLLGLAAPAPGWSRASEGQYGGGDRTGTRARVLRTLPYSPAMRWAYRLPRSVRRRAWDLALAGARRTGRAQLPDPIAARLREALAPDAERLRELTGLQTPGWSV